MRYSESTGCFYPTFISYKSLPDDITEVPDEDFDLFLKRPIGSKVSLVNGRIKIESVVKTPEEIKIEQEQQIRSKYSKMLLDLTKPYSQEERETWGTQEKEATQWVENNSAQCYMIRQMATNRGIPLELLVQKILVSAQRFRQASGQILGLQQAELDVIYPEKKEEI